MLDKLESWSKKSIGIPYVKPAFDHSETSAPIVGTEKAIKNHILKENLLDFSLITCGSFLEILTGYFFNTLIIAQDIINQITDWIKAPVIPSRMGENSF